MLFRSVSSLYTLLRRMRRLSCWDWRVSIWSAAATSGGGRGRALCVLDEKADPGRGEEGSELFALGCIMDAVDSPTGLRDITRCSEEGMGRLRSSIEEVAGTCSDERDAGRGGGGEGGGEC